MTSSSARLQASQAQSARDRERAAAAKHKGGDWSRGEGGKGGKGGKPTKRKRMRCSNF